MLRIRIYGIVQGVGFRPTVSRHATEHQVTGSVCNKGPYVEVLAQGTKEQLDGFVDAIEHRSPMRSVILKMNVEELPDEEKFSTFEIIESAKTKGDIFVSPDIAICDQCKKEMYDPTNRRYLHPFINCTCCGPRLTILDSMPYDRERTSMKEFPMCPDCEKEYTTQEDRRFDAQPVCCNDCGPEVYLLDRKERGKEAITKTREIISQGGIVAVKGIGGYHLCCDATSQEAVTLLRTRKTRPAKPFAVMMRNMDVVRRECEIEEGMEEILDGHQKPILLLNRKSGGKICQAVAPDNPKIGVMLPYAPVQLLLFDYDDDIVMPDVLVMTSGNVSGAPICRDDEDARSELGGLCDAVLSHNRKIRLRADDTVMSFYEGKPYMIRRSRGFAPLPVMLSTGWKGCVVAVGGELKNSFCVASDELLYLSPYIGDMADVRTVKALRESVVRMETLLETEPTLAVCDLHPGYHTTEEAEKLGLPLLSIQHHYAHILSCMAENDARGPVLGVSLDGTGYGTDKTIWGGEFLKADYDDFTRLGSIEPFLQVGGDTASREGWRIAVSMIHQLYSEDEAYEIVRRLNLCDEKTAKIQFSMADHRLNSVVSTSTGRLFDGVSAILGIRRQSTFEGEAATAMQFAAEAYLERSRSDKQEKIRSHAGSGLWSEHAQDPPEDGKMIPYGEGQNSDFLTLSTMNLVKELIQGRLEGMDEKQLAYEFHKGLAELIINACEILCRQESLATVALSGGVYQNQLLLDLSKKGLERLGLNVLIHSLVPPNDGGIALGQAAAGLYRLSQSNQNSQ